MSISSRIHDTVETWQAEWKDRLRGWALRTISEGVKKFLEDDEPAAIDNVSDMIAKIRANPATSPEQLALLDRLEKGGSWFMIVMAIVMGVQAVIGLVTTLWQPGLKQVNYAEERKAQTFRFDAAAITRLWLRDKAKYAELFADLQDQGWSPDRIIDLKELAKLFPPLPDMVRFADYGSFDPKIIEEWREMYDAPGFITEPLATIGITNEKPWEWASKYWFSHWTQPGRFELNDMFRRGLLSGKAYPAGRTMTPEEIEEGRRILKITYLTQGYSSYWQDKLADTVKEIPTRVDVRRFWDMRTIDEARLREIYQARGYFGKDLEDYVLWTKVYVAFPDLMARWKNGWITLDDVRRELTALGMPADRVEEMIQMKVKPEEPERVAEGRELTKTEIYKGVKKELITWEQGLELLMDMGYDYDEADYILAINVGVLEGSPETYEEFKDLTTKWRKAAGMTTPEFNDKLKAAGAELVRATEEVRTLEESVKDEEFKLVDQDVIPEEAEKRLKELQVALNRARSEKVRLQQAYDALVAEFRHTEV